ncbi:MAG: leucine--tRNA ligase [archaeon]
MADFQKIEKKWQKRWKESKIFEGQPDPSRKKFFITVPYPYVSGPYHIGHGRSYIIGDVFARYKRLKGYNVLFPMAYHVTGTPVLAVSQGIKSSDPKFVSQMREYIAIHTQNPQEVEKILNSFTDPWSVYEYFSNTMRVDFESIGMGVDWRRDFTTGDKIYNQFIWWQYFKFKEKGYLVKGSYPILYSIADQNAVGEDDIKDGDIDKVSISEFSLLKFKFDGAYIVAATLRPETVFGQTNMWVHPDVEYVKAQFGKEAWVLSQPCFDKLKYQGKEGKITGKIRGSEMLGRYCHAPGVERDIIILPSYHCDPDVGTGLVTSVPSDAPFDWMGLHDLQKDRKLAEKFGLSYEKIKAIKPIPIIKSKGYGDLPGVEICEKMKIRSQAEFEKLTEATNEIYKLGFHTGVMMDACGEYAGMSVQEAKDKVKADLESKGLADTMYEASRKAETRGGGKVIVAKLDDQWFLDYKAGSWKKLASDCLKQMVIYPEKYRGLFEVTFDWLDKRPCARKRGLGTQLPFDTHWVIESLSDSTIYMAFYTIAGIIKQNKIRPECLIPEVFDFVFLSKGSLADVSKRSKIGETVLQAMHAEFNYWYPMDLRHTAIMHINNHLSFSIFHHAAIFPAKLWPKAFTLIEPVIAEGKKIGKSKGNVIPLAVVSRKYGADLFRLYMINNAEFGTTVDWREPEVIATKKQLEKFYSFVLDAVELSKKAKKSESVHAKAALSFFNRQLREIESHLDGYNLRKYTQSAFYSLFNYMQSMQKLLTEAEQGYVFKEILPKWVVVLSPVMPHFAEEAWELLGNKPFASLSAWPVADGKLIDEGAEIASQTITNTLSDTEIVMKLAKIEKPSKISLFVAHDWKFRLFSSIKAAMENTRNPKDILDLLMKDTELKKHSKDMPKIVFSVLKDPSKIPPIILDQKAELKAVESSVALLKEKYGCQASVQLAEKSSEPKANSALPGKPAILVA